MSLRKEVLGFVVHGPIRIHHCNYIHMDGVGGYFPNSFFFFASMSTVDPRVLWAMEEPTLMANSHLLNSILHPVKNHY